MTRPASVLFAIPELDAGGPDRVFHELLTGLDRQRFTPILVVSRTGGRYFDQLPADIDVECIGGGRYPAWHFARAVDKLRPDLVFTTLRMNVTAAAASYLQRHRPPLISRQANAIAADFEQLRKQSHIKHRVAERVVRYLLKRPNALVAQSRDMAEELGRDIRLSQKIAIIGNPVALEEIWSAFEEQKVVGTGAPWGNPGIVAVGRLAPQKGFDVLLPAFALLRREAPSAGLTIWGEGPQRRELEAQARALGLEEAVRLPGKTDTVLKEIGEADVLVSSSRYEGFSNVILEAMALGTPVVATDCPGASRDLVLDSITGFLVPGLKAELLADGIRKALAANREALAAAAKSHIATEFDKRIVLQRYEDLFASQLTNRAW